MSQSHTQIIMLYLSTGIFLVAFGLLGDASPALSTVGPDTSFQLQERTQALDCPSCSLSHMKRNSSVSGEQNEMVEAVKRHILNMLHMSTRPNLTQPIPRIAMLNAIKKLHVGRVTEDGSVEIQEEGQAAEAPTPKDPPSEIITFAEPGGSLNSVAFDISTNSKDSMVVEQASIWIFFKVAKGNRAKGKVMLRLLCHYGDGDKKGEGDCVSEKMVDTRRSGWHTFSIPFQVQALLDGGSSLLILQVSCPLCTGGGVSPILTSGDAVIDQSHRPFLTLTLRARKEAAQRRVKRGLECDGKLRLCCKRQFYVDFKDIGWSDWIIAPSGYHANYCEGDCPNHMASLGGLSFHSTVINHYRLRGHGAFQNTRSCCVPTRLRAMSMLYFNEEQKIIKKDVQDMIVDECGCS